MAKDKTWSQKLAEAKGLQSKGAGLAWERAVLYVEIERDRDFRSHCERNEWDTEALLDGECADLCCSFAELRSILETFPDREQWTGGKLHILKAEALELQARGRRESTGPRKSKVAEQAARIKELETQIAELTTELTRERARREELERVLSREFAAA